MKSDYNQVWMSLVSTYLLLQELKLLFTMYAYAYKTTYGF